MPYPDDVAVLTDGRVTLRAHSLDDVAGVVEQCTDPESIAWTTVPVPYGEDDARHWISQVVPEGWRDATELCFAVEHAGRFAGSVSLRPDRDGNAELAFGLAAWARGQRVGSAAVRLLLRWGLAERGFPVVHWRANVGNWPSRRLAWATGFHFGPTVPKLLDHRGERRDAWTGWITADDEMHPRMPWLDTPVLHTDRLRLRAWRDDDGPRLVEAAHDDRLRHFIPETPLPRQKDRVPGYLLRVRLAAADGNRLAWCVADPETDLALGNVAVFDFEGEEPDMAAQLGYWSHPDARGRGVMSEAVRRVADWSLAPAGDGMGLRRLYLLTAAGNTASRHVAEQAGFMHVGTERAGARVGDGFDHNAVYDRLR